MQLVLKHLYNDDKLCFELPSISYLSKLKELLKKCEEKNHGYVLLTLERPRKPRTTGDLSQNNLIWKLITIIANEVGDNSEGMKDTEKGIKMRALSKGYPFHINPLTGEKEPESMKKIDTIQCGYLIETAYEVIAELGIILEPKMNIWNKEK